MISNRLPNASTSPDRVERQSPNRKKPTRNDGLLGQIGAADALTVQDVEPIQTSSVLTSARAQATQRVINTISGGRGNDDLLGTAGDDQITGKQGNDRLEGRDGNDRLFGNQGNDRLFGENGNDRLDGGNNADILRGGSGRDRLIGGDKSDILEGENGNDRLLGGNGRDTLRGGAGADRISGSNGKDVIVGGFGQDRLTGGGDNDRFVYNSTSEGRDRIVDFDTDEDKLDFSAIFSSDKYNTDNRFRDYLVVVNDEDDTLIRVDPDGEDGDRLFKTVVRLVDTNYEDVSKSNFIGL